VEKALNFYRLLNTVICVQYQIIRTEQSTRCAIYPETLQIDP